MRILLTVPHYFSRQSTDESHGSSIDTAQFRQRALTNCLLAIHQTFGRPQCVMQLNRQRTDTANAKLTALTHVVVCTAGDRHLLHNIGVDPAFYQQYPVPCEPSSIGFECRNLLRDRWGSYDWYGFLEDDLILNDPWLFTKLNWFIQQAGQDAVLLPNRFERGITSLATKAYVDGDIADRVTRPFQDISDRPVLSGTVLGCPVEFFRPLNPHSGCYFLNAAQMATWIAHPDFSNRDTSFVGPLESAATLSLMKTFRIYKPAPANAGFLEIEHAGRRFISQLRRPESADRTSATMQESD